MDFASAENLLDYLELIFHTDLGDGHLEHFEKGQELDSDLISTTNNPIVGIISNQIHKSTLVVRFVAPKFVLKDDPFPNPLLGCSISLRGPPAIS